jgi:hypothetical protein
MTDDEYAEALAKRLDEELRSFANWTEFAAVAQRAKKLCAAFKAEHVEAPKHLSAHVCARCGEAFVSLWPDEEALAESEANFGEHPKEELEIVCDDCWKEIRPS